MLFIVKRIIGVLCIVLGLGALFTPLTPGSWLILIGLELVGLGFLMPGPVRRPVQSFKQKIKERFHAWWHKKRPKRS